MARSLSRSLRLFLRLAIVLSLILIFIWSLPLHQWLSTVIDSHQVSKHPQSVNSPEPAHLASRIRIALSSTDHFRSRLGISTTDRGALLKHVFSFSSSGASGDTSTTSYLETRDPPNIKLDKTESPPTLGPLPKNHPLEKAYTNALKDVDDAVRRIIANDPIISLHEFKNRTAGIPGTAITTNAERISLQKWLDCTSTQGEWRWQPLANSSARRPLTVHKQGPLEARCDRSYYQARERGEGNLSDDGWSVRPSLQFRWYPSNRCDSLRPRQLKDDVHLSRKDLCRLLRHKNILMVGDVTQFSLHDLLLDWTSTKPVTCYGDLYCKEHGICGHELTDDWDGSAIELESGALDDHVYQRLPTQPNLTSFSSYATNPSLENVVGSLNASPSDLFPRSSLHNQAGRKTSKESPKQSSKPARGTILRFRRSDSLWASSSPSHRRFDPIWLHDNTGIRDINNYWITDSRKSDLVILSRPPLPFPLPSHRHKAFTKTTEIPAPHLQYLRHVSNNKSCPSVEFFETGGVIAAASLIDMARRMVLEVWLPEIMYSLLSLRSTASPPDQLMVWRGDWRIQPDCAKQDNWDDEQKRHRDSETDHQTRFDWKNWWQRRAEGDGPPLHSSPPSLLSIMYSDFADQLYDQKFDRFTASRRKTLDAQTHIRDPRTVFHNLQVIFQNQLMRQLAPAFGIPYLDLESLTSVWRSGMVGGSSVSSIKKPFKFISSQPQVESFDQFHSSINLLKSKIGQNCLHYCFPSPGMVIEEGFIGGLLKIFHLGWDQHDYQSERDNWVGELFIPLRERILNRNAL
ncbi:hypothetical protein CROQUDRAFT_658384 [Cronartium quercuum f. sp. fusiforme G11]|uniref:Uncharacterized protein n=1 Tax=Cronartium quercuum f. sp. fusiforme G11 TaxID=708437 RepID=A0A9P6NKI2_9BASI|nr:hypothetical protein CROQUDRAFT_658384 [Cronartium quercuum f. sp. fusiforme G11]